MILELVFKETVKLTELHFVVPKNERSPKVIKCYKNRRNMDFSGCESCTPTEVVTLRLHEQLLSSETLLSDEADCRVYLRAVRWAHVDSSKI